MADCDQDSNAHGHNSRELRPPITRRNVTLQIRVRHREASSFTNFSPDSTGSARLHQSLPCAWGHKSWGGLRLRSPDLGTSFSHPTTTYFSTGARRVMHPALLMPAISDLGYVSCRWRIVKKDEDKMQDVSSMSSLPHCSLTLFVLFPSTYIAE